MVTDAIVAARFRGSLVEEALFTRMSPVRVERAIRDLPLGEDLASRLLARLAAAPVDAATRKLLRAQWLRAA